MTFNQSIDEIVERRIRERTVDHYFPDKIDQIRHDCNVYVYASKDDVKNDLAKIGETTDPTNRLKP